MNGHPSQTGGEWMTDYARFVAEIKAEERRAAFKACAKRCTYAAALAVMLVTGWAQW